MASKPGTLKRSKATRRRGERASSDPLRDSTSPSPTRERQGSVTFDNQASTIYLTEDDILTQDDSSQLDTDGNQTDNYSAEKSGRNWCFLCRIQVELTCSRLFFRIFAVINFLSLIFSGPLVECDRQIDTTNGTQSAGCNAVFIQFVTITAVDFVLAIVYTLHTIARIEYAIHLLFKKSKVHNMLRFLYYIHFIATHTHTHTHTHTVTASVIPSGCVCQRTSDKCAALKASLSCDYYKMPTQHFTTFT